MKKEYKKATKLMSKDRFLKDKWYRMSRRVKGDPTYTNRPHLYKGLNLCSKKHFMEWATSHPWFNRLWNAYIRSEREIRFAPSIDRKDNSLGYVEGNMRWITHSKNCSLGASSITRK